MTDWLRMLKEELMDNLEGILFYLILLAFCALIFIPLAAS